LCGDFAGCAQNSHPDRAADGHGQTKANAENAQEFSAIGR
jgi:hypothetical protein